MVECNSAENIEWANRDDPFDGRNSRFEPSLPESDVINLKSFERAQKVIEKLDLDKKNIALCGSFALARYGFSGQDDIDIIVTRDEYQKLKNKLLQDNLAFEEKNKNMLSFTLDINDGQSEKVEITYNWLNIEGNGEAQTEEVIKNAHKDVSGIPVVGLREFIKYSQSSYDDKERLKKLEEVIKKLKEMKNKFWRPEKFGDRGVTFYFPDDK